MEAFKDHIIEELLQRLSEGESLRTICADPRMPSRQSVHTWSRQDDDLAARILDAREVGYYNLAERAVEDARTCDDPIKGRLAFDAVRWQLGKLSRVFADKPIALGVQVNVGADDAFAAVSGALESAAAAIASRGDSTFHVDTAGAARPANPTRQLADLASDGGEGLGEDADRR